LVLVSFDAVALVRCIEVFLVLSAGVVLGSGSRSFSFPATAVGQLSPSLPEVEGEGMDGVEPGP